MEEECDAKLSIAHHLDRAGVKAVKRSAERLDAAKQAVQAVCGRIIFVYMTMGQYNLAVLYEFPDDETAAKALLAVAQQGNISSQTLRAFTEAEYRSITAGLP